jgi:5-methylcytosine-specific restriction endonuclease McrA
MTDPTKSAYRYLSFKSQTTYRRFVQQIGQSDLVKVNNLPTEEESPAHGTYGGELFKPEWKAKREEIIKRDSYQCKICKASHVLQVHHRQYHFVVREKKFRSPWDYSDHLLITLCESCHKRGHSKYKVPIINI